MLTLRLGRRCACGPARIASSSFSTTAVVNAASAPIKRPKFKPGLGPKKRAALARGQRLAQSLEKAQLEEELQSTESKPPPAPQVNPRVADFEALIPEDPPVVSKPTYPEHHAKLVAAINNAFLRGQLREISENLETPVEVRSTDKKADIIQKLLDQWKWVEPRDRSLYMPATQQFPMSIAEIFLVNRDQHATEWLAGFSDIRLSVTEMDAPGKFALSVTALPSVLEQVGEFLRYRRDAYVTKEWSAEDMHGFVPTQATMWAIANMTGACIEKTPSGTYLATGPTGAEVTRAKDMVMTAATRAAGPRLALAAALPSPSQSIDGEHYYALTPHLPAMSSPLPWETAAAVGSRPLFRLTRAVGVEWIRTREARHRAEDILQCEVYPFTGPEAASVGALVDSGTEKVPIVDGATQSTVVQLGHLLSPSDGSSVLTPPIKGAWPLASDSPLADMPPPVFSPAVPPLYLCEPLIGTVSRSRKVTYRREGADERLTITYTYPRDEAKIEEPKIEEPQWFKELKGMLPETKRPSDDVPVDSIESLLGPDIESPEPTGPDVSFRIQTEAASDLMLPDRPIDARLLARAVKDLPQGAIPQLDFFLQEVHQHPQTRNVPLSDIATLRKGGQQGVDTGAWHDPEFDEFMDNLGEDVSSEVMGDIGEEPTSRETSRPMPAPTATEAFAIIPPSTIVYGGQKYSLHTDEMQDVVEEVSDGITTRIVSSVDMRGPGGVVRYAELAGAAPPLFERLRTVSRDLDSAVAPHRLGM